MKINSKSTMIKMLALTALLFMNTIVNAQEAGIKFESGLSWAQIKEKALKENKYIFLDGYTTWCGPCKQMAKEIFPQPKVGEFFNKNFLNVAVQFDVTKRDNKEIKNWYKDASDLQKTYKIGSFPTYLFFNPQGELVHSIYGAIPDADEFIRNTKEALDPKKQYLTLKRQYEAGKREPDFLYSLIAAALTNWDNELIPAAAAAYMATKPDLLAENNLKILPHITKKISDPGFNILREYGDQADRVTGEGRSKELVKTIIFEELVLPVIRIDGKRIDYAGGMYDYAGQVAKAVEWDKVKTELDAKFPDLAEEILLFSKLEYLKSAKNWSELNMTIHHSLITNNKAITQRDLRTIANFIFLKADDLKTLHGTIDWSKQNLENIPDKNDKLNFMVTYAQLLNKAGRKDEAIKQLETTVKLTDGKAQYFIDFLENMKNGKKLR